MKKTSDSIWWLTIGSGNIGTNNALMNLAKCILKIFFLKKLKPISDSYRMQSMNLQRKSIVWFLI